MMMMTKAMLVEYIFPIVAHVDLQIQAIHCDDGHHNNNYHRSVVVAAVVVVVAVLFLY